MMIPIEESLAVEFKSDKDKLPDSNLFEAVVAFANTEGGEIYLGVEDDGSVSGLHEAHLNPITLAAYIANNTVPPISVRTEILDTPSPVLKISIPKSYGGIAATASGKILRRRLKLDGKPENVPMYPTEISTRLSSLRLLDYSAMPISEANIEDLDPLETERLRKAILSYNGDRALLELRNDELYKALGFVKEVDGRLMPTVTGLLMIGKTDAIKSHIPTHLTSLQVLEGTRIINNEETAIPILAAIELLNTFLEARNPEHELEFDMFRMSINDFNKRAIREGILNSYAHRDYTRLGRVRICISDEGLTIANPGGFIEGVSVFNLMTAEPFGRNPLLADALKRVGLAEKTGRGIDRIFEGSLLYGRQMPDYTASTAIAVVLFIPRSKVDARLTKIISDEQRAKGRPLTISVLLVLNALRDAPKSNVAHIAKLTNLSMAIAQAALNSLIEAGIVTEFGNKNEFIISSLLYKHDLKASKSSTSNKLSSNRQRESIIELATDREFITRSDIMILLNIPDSNAYRLLKRLADEGILIPENKGRYARYRYAGTL
jgi:ATP-dependent DNA helicase RecG